MRKLISLYFDTFGAFILFVALLLIVWLSMNALPITTAVSVAKELKEKTKEERIAAKDEFVVKYVSGKSLSAANDPSTIAFGGGSEVRDNKSLHYYSSDFDFSFTSPREDMLTFVVEKERSTKLEDLESMLEKPIIKLGKTENHFLSNVQSQPTVKQKTALSKDVSHIIWQLPDNILMSRMPNLEGLLRKYGWLTGNLEMMLTTDDNGFVSNVIIYSIDNLDVSFLRDLKKKLLTLHLGKENASQALPISISWNLP